MATRIRPPHWSPTQGDAIWTTRVFPDNRMARLRDHRREGLAVLLARIKLTCVLPLTTEIRDSADGSKKTTTIGSIRAVRRATGRTNLDMY
eukprot:4553936-Pyramimonas_sp.AAC.1